MFLLVHGFGGVYYRTLRGLMILNLTYLGEIDSFLPFLLPSLSSL